MRKLFQAALVALMLVPTGALADTGDNLQIALQAARKMEWDPVYGENRAFLLIKRETIRAEVGLIFGYVDNAAACEAIAVALSQSGTTGTFECDAAH